MKTKRIPRQPVRLLCLILVLGLALLGSEYKVSSAPAGQTGSLALMQVEPGQISWQPLVPYARLDLTVARPDGSLFTRSFPPDSLPVLELADPSGAALPDGLYGYELKLSPLLDAKTRDALLAAAGDADARLQVVEDLRAAGKLPLVTSMSGTFSIRGGQFVPPDEKIEQEKPASPASSGAITPNDVVTNDDSIITGGLCVGFDCLTDGTENFGFDTIKLKENNLRIFFDDTSATAGFPANDWRISLNDSPSGGANYFAIEDSTAAKTPFRIDAGAPNNALYVNSLGRIGLGTSTPAVRLHMVWGDTPAVRLEQDTSSGWTAQTWDVAGNESNFFIRDVTNGSKLPLRIQPNAPSSSLTVKSDGKIGLGTWTPAYPVDLERTGQDAVYAAVRTDGATAILSAGASDVRIGSVTSSNVSLVVNNTPVMTLTAQRNMTLAGALSEYSDVNVKKNFAPVNGRDVLDRLSQVPIMTWNYKADDANVTHMGPMAQDFYAAFGLGPDDRHIAALDANGVSLSAIQALARITSDQEARLNRLEEENVRLRTRLAWLYAGVLVLALLLAAWRIFPLLARRLNLIPKYN